MDSFSHKLYVDTLGALSEVNSNAINFLFAHPNVSSVKLVKKLNEEASAFGFVIAVYREAIKSDQVRSVAKELLYREIVNAFPKGWSSKRKICPAVYLVNWITGFKSNVSRQNEVESADKIYSDIARDALPHEGWKPQSADDPYLVQLFDRNWPVATK